MVLLRLMTVFGFVAVLAGCDVRDDVKQLNNKIEMVKNDIVQFKEDSVRLKRAIYSLSRQLQPCKAPEQHSAITCYYKLEIIKPVGNSQYQGKVPDTVVLEANNRCKTAKENPDPNQCVDYGDTRPYIFTIDGSNDKTYPAGTVVECTNDPRDNDPKTNHLHCTLAQQMKKT